MNTPQPSPNQAAARHPYASKGKNYDRFGSTFRHEIHMLAGSKLEGYSKTMGKNEHSDKAVVLMGVLERVWFASNYRGKALKMEFFWQQQGLVKDDHVKVLTVTASNFLLEPEALSLRHLQKALDKLFNFRGTGLATRSLDELFNVEKQREAERNNRLAIGDRFHARLIENPYDTAPLFANNNELYEYCVQLLEEGSAPVGRLQNYYRDMVSRYPEKYGLGGPKLNLFD